MSSSDVTAWAAVPWVAVEGGADPIGWRKRGVPYVPNALSLQTLDVWVTAAGSDPPEASALPVRPGRWIVFIHGGAWRDPLVTSEAFDPTAQNLLQHASSGGVPIAGLASINYRLSPHPDHPTDPSPPKDGSPPDPARQARQPDHISDVLSALAFLQRLGGAADGYVLSGHSCGATLTFQTVMDSKRWGPDLAAPTKPAVVVGLNGLYDLAGFLASPPAGYEWLAEEYGEFTRLAFGDDPAGWKAACPTTAQGWTSEWTGAEKAVLVQSRADSLVPYSQLEGLRAVLKAAGAGFEVLELEAGGDHNDLWRQGDRMAEIFEEVLRGLS